MFTQTWFGEPWRPPLDYVPIWEDPWRNLSQLIWPALATGYRYSAVATRMTRSAMLEILDMDFIVMARAKGVDARQVIWKHALRNALIPPLTVSALMLTGFITGTVLVEVVFIFAHLIQNTLVGK